MALKQVDFQVLISGKLNVEAETDEQATLVVKEVLGTSISTAVRLHPVNTKIDMQVKSLSGLVASNGPVPINRAGRRAAGRG